MIKHNVLQIIARHINLKYRLYKIYQLNINIKG